MSNLSIKRFALSVRDRQETDRQETDRQDINRQETGEVLISSWLTRRAAADEPVRKGDWNGWQNHQIKGFRTVNQWVAVLMNNGLTKQQIESVTVPALNPGCCMAILRDRMFAESCHSRCRHDFKRFKISA